jgi:hypothetical protein
MLNNLDIATIFCIFVVRNIHHHINYLIEILYKNLQGEADFFTSSQK